MNTNNIKTILSKITLGTSKWELDNILYHDRTTNLETLYQFLNRIDSLSSKENRSLQESNELKNLLELLEDMNLEDCLNLIDSYEETARDLFIEQLARKSAIELLTNKKISYETMNISCKLSPSDFILCAKRTQDLINSVHSLVIKGETLSKDVAGA